jgi:hypothetical protein
VKLNSSLRCHVHSESGNGESGYFVQRSMLYFCETKDASAKLPGKIVLNFYKIFYKLVVLYNKGFKKKIFLRSKQNKVIKKI